MALEDGDRVLSYGDVVLFGCDVEPLFQRGGWLTDNLLAFAAIYLKNGILGKEYDDKICLVFPTLCEMFKYSPASSVELYKEVGLSSNKWCLFMLSDSFHPGEAFSGSHWCLILFDALARRFRVFDSAVNRRIGCDTLEFIRKLVDFFNVDEKNSVELFEPCPTMSISGDCGLYVIEYIRVILQCLKNYFDSSGAEPPDFERVETITDEHIQNSRHLWITKLGELYKEQKQSSCSSETS